MLAIGYALKWRSVEEDDTRSYEAGPRGHLGMESLR